MPAREITGAVVRGPGRIEAAKIALEEPGSGQVALAIEACGICGSDLHMLGGGGAPTGHTPGHEMCGRVVRVGPDVADLAEGTRVVVEPTAACRKCRYCREGNPQLCRELEIYGVHLRGGLADEMVVRADCLHPVDETLAAEVAALAEPIAVAVHGLRRASVARGDRILVLGAGTIGLVTTLAARAAGAEVWQTARYAHQAEHALRLGATRVLREEEADSRALSKLSRHTDFDTVVETVGGHADTLLEACHAVRPGGRIVVLGIFLESPEIAPLPLLVKEATVMWSDCYARPDGNSDFAAAISVLEAERELAATLTTHQFSLDDVGDAFEAAADRKSGAIKISVMPRHS